MIGWEERLKANDEKWLLMMVAPWEGNEWHPPMVWSVREVGDGTWAVIESHDGMRTWVVNCYCKTLAGAMKFVDDWFDSMKGN